MTSSASSDLLCCPVHHTPLSRDGDHLVCAECGPVGQWKGKVLSFLPKADAFYEGKYLNRTRYIPANDGFLATLPMRIVHQGYPTRVAQLLPPGATVVEIGCAGGMDWFGRRFRMIGVDLSEASLRAAAENYELAIQCDATQLPLTDGSADGVISSCLFEHLLPEQKHNLLSESYRVLRPGGKLVFFYDIETTSPLISAYRKQRPDLYQKLFLDGDGHLGYESIEANRAYFEAAGFKIIGEVMREHTPFLANSSWQKFAQWPGFFGTLGKVGQALTAGPARLPALAAISFLDATVGRLLPPSHARCITTVAVRQ